MKRYVLHCLWLLNGALCVPLAWQWLTPEGELKNVHWVPPAAQKSDFSKLIPALPPIAPADTNQFMALLDRPLFSVTRRPPPPPPPPAPPPPVDHLASAVLSGIVDAGPASTVMINVAGSNRRVRLNAQVEGWTLTAVQGRNATFVRNGETRVVPLQKAKMTTYAGLSRAALSPAAAAPVPSGAPGGAPPSPDAPAAAPAVTPQASALRPVFGAPRQTTPR